jgi:flagellar motor protein MotB
MSGGGSSSDDGPPGVGLWIVSFSDCMVNLMAFFLMMLTFSSTSHNPKTRVEGPYPTPAGNSVLEGSNDPQGSVVKSVRDVTDFTESGSEMPTEQDAIPTRNPRESPGPLVGADVYKTRHDVIVSCRKLFWGEGSVLRPGGQEYLKLLAGYLVKVSNRVAVSAGPRAADMERATAIIEFLSREAGLAADRFSILAWPPPRRADQQATVGITILSGSPCP